jgi:hypothetical protein
MATIHELLPDYCLLPFEVELAKAEMKNLFILPESMSIPGRLLFLNGMTFVVEKVHKNRSLSSLSKIECLMFGCKIGLIRAECEHPEFYCPYYGTTWNSGTRDYKEALREYCEHSGQYDYKKKYTMIETMYGLYPAKKHSPRTEHHGYSGIYDEANLNHCTHLPSY